jgi:hypothetical protein
MTHPERVLMDRYRCPDSFLNITLQDVAAPDSGFFRFGPNTICYGRSATGYRGSRVGPTLYDVAEDVRINQSEICLPFDPTEIVENFQLERYHGTESWIRTRAKKAYYHVRPYLHRSLREQVQKFQLRRWRELPFPGWPVDTSAENLSEQLFLLVLQATGADRIPFIWFWPEGRDGCVVMTHDVEGAAGRDACVDLMDIDDSYGIKASFTVVPQGSYSVSQTFLASIRDRGFEIGIQDLNHDGRLFDERKEFLRRARLINQYAREYGASGFRSAVLYRRPEWYDVLNFSYDSSIPNTGRLDPQRGGCCTVMPYFIGNMVELPVTTTQDYTLFHLLSERSIELWKTQIRLILEKNGLISFIVHPDYLVRDEVKTLYIDLLSHLRELRATRKIWQGLPSEVDSWWRARSKMQLVQDGNDWHIEGEGAERAVVAYAKTANGKLVYELEPALSRSGVNQR